MLDQVFYQAHRGTVDEGPENTLAALRYGWQFTGAIPETDARTTADGELVCIHDATLARTTNAPVEVANRPIRELTLAEVRRWDAGIRYSQSFAGQRVPTLDEVLDELHHDPTRRLYLEPKDADLTQIKAYLARHGVTSRILFVSGYPAVLAEIQELFPGAQAMTWIGGPPETIAARLRQAVEARVENITQLQVHLHPAAADQTGLGLFALDDELLLWAMEQLAHRHIALQVRPMQLSAPGLAHLLSLGVRWFVADAPGKFDAYLRQAIAQSPAIAQSASMAASDEIIYHITTVAAWQAAQATGTYQPSSLAAEGFIHCSRADQVLPVANSFYQGQQNLLLLAIRAGALGGSLVYEAPAAADDTFAAQRFPHVYGPIPLTAVIATAALPREPAGDFRWPTDLPINK